METAANSSNLCIASSIPVPVAFQQRAFHPCGIHSSRGRKLLYSIHKIALDQRFWLWFLGSAPLNSDMMGQVPALPQWSAHAVSLGYLGTRGLPSALHGVPEVGTRIAALGQTSAMSPRQAAELPE